jgi:antitoxin VapB
VALNIKDRETERLAAEVASLAGESKTGAIRTALRERRARLLLHGTTGRREALQAYLEEDVWPMLVSGARGRAPTKAEQEALLGLDAST